MKIAFVGSYPPRKCGIATFTRDLLESMSSADNKIEPHVVAINNNNETYVYPDNVKYEIRQNHKKDYLEAADFINYRNTDACLLQHEFGIFGGENGVFVLRLIHQLKVPLYVTFHTILKSPNVNEQKIIQEIGKKAKKIIVMSRRAIKYLEKYYGIAPKKIELIEHGVPDLNSRPDDNVKKHLNFGDNRTTLLTFGLLSRNKGIETVLNALPKVIENHPDLLYIIVGKTHPNVIKIDGEEYRNHLMMLTGKNKIRDNVLFINRYVSNAELFNFLLATDIYISPYLNKAQITSGTLSYAVGAGAGIISTPYWHAQELLADGRGRLFNFGDSEALAKILTELLDNPDELTQLRKNAYEYGRNLIWPKIGAQYVDLIKRTTKSKLRIKFKETIINPALLPPFCLNHVKRMTDTTGIIQHAKYSVPKFQDGYCLDDNARALLAVAMAFHQIKEPEAGELITTYLSYIFFMQNGDGTFRNFLSYKREFLDEIGSEDSFGRAIWALGHTIRYSLNEAHFQLAKEMFEKARPHFENLQYLRGMANTIAGICHYLKRYPDDTKLRKTLLNLMSKILALYEKECDDNWRWFEPQLTYDNGIIPMALFSAYNELHNKKILKVATDSLKFLESLTFRDGHIAPIGSLNWYPKGGRRSQFPQQPIDVMAMTLMYDQAYLATSDKNYIQKMSTAYKWFLGENDLGMPLYDFETCGCMDGLEEYGVNYNQGAESMLAYLISHLTVLRLQE